MIDAILGMMLLILVTLSIACALVPVVALACIAWNDYRRWRNCRRAQAQRDWNEIMLMMPREDAADRAALVGLA